MRIYVCNWIAFMRLEAKHARLVGWIGSFSVLLIIVFECLCVTVDLQPLSVQCNFCFSIYRVWRLGAASISTLNFLSELPLSKHDGHFPT